MSRRVKTSGKNGAGAMIGGLVVLVLVFAFAWIPLLVAAIVYPLYCKQKELPLRKDYMVIGSVVTVASLCFFVFGFGSSSDSTDKISTPLPTSSSFASNPYSYPEEDPEAFAAGGVLHSKTSSPNSTGIDKSSNINSQEQSSASSSDVSDSFSSTLVSSAAITASASSKAAVSTPTKSSAPATASPPASAAKQSPAAEAPTQQDIPKTDEITGPLSKTTYWTPKGKSYHFSSGCRTLSRSKTIYSGTLQEARDAGKTDPCNVCAGG